MKQTQKSADNKKRSEKRSDLLLLALYTPKYANASVKMKKSTDKITVNRWRIKSRPLAFCLPKSCSAPPEIAPDSPALLLDCSNTTMISAILTITSNVITNACMKTPPDKLVHIALFYMKTRCMSRNIKIKISYILSTLFVILIQFRFNGLYAAFFICNFEVKKRF